MSAPAFKPAGLAAAFNMLRESRRQRAISRTLTSLDDHILRDIGMARPYVDVRLYYMGLR